MVPSPTPPRSEPRRWYQRDVTIILLFVVSALTLLLVLPIGITALILMWRHTTWPTPLKWLLTLVIPAPVYLLLAVVAAGPYLAPARHPTPGTLGTIPLTDPVSVAIGAHDSVYVVDGTHIVHFSGTGRLLRRLGSTETNVAVDRAGNVYNVRQGRLEVVSPTGRVVRHWSVGVADRVVLDRQGRVYVTNRVPSSEEMTRIRRFTLRGRLLNHWLTPYGDDLAPGGDGLVYAIGQGDLAQLDPSTGRVLTRWMGSAPRGTMTYDAMAADPRGTIYVGATVDGDTPFVIQKLTHTGRGYTFTLVNASEELVADLAIDAHGDIYVIRNSYARPCASNLGLDKLSPTGTVVGTFRSCPQTG